MIYDQINATSILFIFEFLSTPITYKKKKSDNYILLKILKKWQVEKKKRETVILWYENNL